MNRHKSLDYRIETQEQSAWCWAAVAASTARFYDPGTEWSQCKVATVCLTTKNGRGILPPHVDTCCGAPWDANVPYALADALAATDTKQGDPIGAMTFDDIVTEIDAGRPVAVSLRWRSAADDHFAVITGYSELGSRRFLRVADPWYGHVHYSWEDQFLSNHLHNASKWTESVRTKAPGGPHGSTT